MRNGDFGEAFCGDLQMHERNELGRVLESRSHWVSETGGHYMCFRLICRKKAEQKKPRSLLCFFVVGLKGFRFWKSRVFLLLE